MEEEKGREPGASIRLWVAILLTIAALWFVDFLLKPVAHRHGTKRTSGIDAGHQKAGAGIVIWAARSCQLQR